MLDKSELKQLILNMMNALALIIGNIDYSLPQHKLINAINDANDVSAKLMTLGFTVRKVTDCTREIFDRAVSEFATELKSYDVGLFYFSGHGLQIDGKNYLTAIDTNFFDSVSAKHTSYPLDQVIDYMQSANPIIKILILDACRENPLPGVFRSTQLSGLAPIYAPKGTIIAFSTSPGEKALDYGSGRNSIYTGALLNHINDPNIPIEDFFKRVRTSVFTLSQGKQTSWEHTSLIGNFYFNSGQLVHSIQLPYKEECVVDSLFVSTGTFIDEAIEKLRSHNFYSQKQGIETFKSINPSSIDKSSLFLFGRNILQSAEGSEFSAQHIMRNLANWLYRYNEDGINHVLNGILFEMYFDSKALFRKDEFKSQFVDEIYSLQIDARYKKSFEFIKEQLTPFSEFLFYLPNDPPHILAIEVLVEDFEYKDWNNQVVKDHKVISIKHEGVELMHEERTSRNGDMEVQYEDFIRRLKTSLCTPEAYLRISINANRGALKSLTIPWKLKLSRFKEVDEDKSY